MKKLFFAIIMAATLLMGRQRNYKCGIILPSEQ